MSIERTELLKNYVAAMHEGDAALFIRAGMSRPAGFVDWRGLLRNCAKELELLICCRPDLGDGFPEVGRNLFRSSKATPVSTAE
jgi:hypothetical protein